MIKGELEDFALLWREEADPAEQEQLEQLARKARSRGKLAEWTDVAWLVMLVGGSIIALFAAFSPPLLAATVVIIIATVWLTLKRRTLRQMTRSLSTSDRQSFLETSIANVRANLRRNTLSLVTFPLLVPLALLLKMGTRFGGEPVAVLHGIHQWVGSPRGMITLALMTVILAFIIRSRRRLQGELRRLRDLSLAYEDEARKDSEAA